MLEKERSWSLGKVRDLCVGIRSEVKCNSEQSNGKEKLGKERDSRGEDWVAEGTENKDIGMVQGWGQD